MSKKNSLIKCPSCGAEYMAAEIYLPNSLVGKPKNIIKDENGLLLNFEGDDVCLSEEYICDKCGKKFTVEASLSFKTAEVKDIFEEEF